jgi:glycosyltransferase involved in cell wall biosynthesis
MPGFGPGGTELRAAALINALGDRFHHGIVSLTGEWGAESRIDPARGVELVQPPRRTGRLQWPVALGRLARSWSPDLVATYNWGATDMILGALPSSRWRIVHNECGFGPDEAVRLDPRRVWFRRLLLNRIHKTVVVSQALLRVAREQFRVAPERLQFIRTGVRVDRFRPGRDFELRRRLGIADDELVVGFVGVLRPEKNLPLLFAAFREADIAGARLLVVGDGPLRAQVESLAADDPRVVLAGRAPDPLPYYRALDAFAMSSVTEQTSNAQLEAMSCGKPCVVTDVGDCAAALGDPRFVVASGDQAGLAAVLRTLARDPGLRDRAGAANRARCESDYSFDRMVDAYGSLWELAARRGPGQS